MTLSGRRPEWASAPQYLDSEPSLGAAAWTSLTFRVARGLRLLANTANRLRPGMISLRISSRLPTRSGCWVDRPVTLPPGRDSEVTKPSPTGSDAIGNTMGITAVAFRVANV